jgi:hypothetical protein
VCRAFIERKKKSLKNDTSINNELFYHGNMIASWNPDGSLSWTLAGWNTKTTRLRLNQLFDMLNLPFRVGQKDNTPYFYNRVTNELRWISSNKTYTVERFDVEVLRRAA